MEPGDANPSPSPFCCRRPPDVEALKKKYAEWLKPCLKSGDEVLDFLKKRFTLEAKPSPYEKILHHALLQPDPDRDGYPQDSLVFESYRVVPDERSEVFYRNRRDGEDLYLSVCRAADFLDGHDIQCLIDVERGVSKAEIDANEVLPFLEGLEILQELGEYNYLAARKREIDAAAAKPSPAAEPPPASPVPPCINHILLFRSEAEGQTLVGLFASAGDRSRGDTLTKIAWDGLDISCAGFKHTLPPSEAELAEAEPGEFQEYAFGVVPGLPVPCLATITARGLRFYSKNHEGWIDKNLHEELKVEKPFRL